MLLYLTQASEFLKTLKQTQEHLKIQVMILPKHALPPVKKLPHSNPFNF